MNKRPRALVALMVAALALAGCSGGPGEGSGDAKGKRLSVWIMQGTNPDSAAFFTAVADAFKAETGATLDVQYVQWADAHDRFVTSIAGGTTPDVAETGTTWTAEFAAAGALAPIGERVSKAGLGDDLVKGLEESGRYDGQLYGMPWYAGVRSLVYRADVFAELEMDPPKNWNDIVAAGERIKTDKPDMVPFAVPGNAEFGVYPWVWGAGGQVATEKGGTWTSRLDSAESREGIRFFTDLATKRGFSTAGATTWKETDMLDSLTQGRLAMGLLGSWTPATIVEKAPELKGAIAATPIPGKSGGMSPSVLGGSHLSIFETAKNKELAWTFVRLMTSGRFAAEWASQTGYFPGLTSLVAESTTTDDPLVEPFARQLVDGGASVPVTPQFGAVQAKQTTNSMIQSILSGQKTVERATSDAAAEMTRLLNEK